MSHDQDPPPPHLTSSLSRNDPAQRQPQIRLPSAPIQAQASHAHQPPHGHQPSHAHQPPQAQPRTQQPSHIHPYHGLQPPQESNARTYSPHPSHSHSANVFPDNPPHVAMLSHPFQHQQTQYPLHPTDAYHHRHGYVFHDTSISQAHGASSSHPYASHPYAHIPQTGSSLVFHPAPSSHLANSEHHRQPSASGAHGSASSSLLGHFPDYRHTLMAQAHHGPLLPHAAQQHTVHRNTSIPFQIPSHAHQPFTTAESQFRYPAESLPSCSTRSRFAVMRGGVETYYSNSPQYMAPTQVQTPVCTEVRNANPHVSPLGSSVHDHESTMSGLLPTPHVAPHIAHTSVVYNRTYPQNYYSRPQPHFGQEARVAYMGPFAGSNRYIGYAQTGRDGSMEPGYFMGSNDVTLFMAGNIEPKKRRLQWTPELHAKFITAVEEFGIDTAVPKLLLQEMNVPGLTRENVASHLQKYRESLRKKKAESEPPNSTGQRVSQQIPTTEVTVGSVEDGIGRGLNSKFKTTEGNRIERSKVILQRRNEIGQGDLENRGWQQKGAGREGIGSKRALDQGMHDLSWKAVRRKRTGRSAGDDSKLECEIAEGGRGGMERGGLVGESEFTKQDVASFARVRARVDEALQLQQPSNFESGRRKKDSRERRADDES